MLSPSVVRFRNQEADYASYPGAGEQGLVEARGAARSRSVLVEQEPWSDAARNKQLPPADALAALERHVRGASLSFVGLSCWPPRPLELGVLPTLGMLIVRRLSLLAPFFLLRHPERTCLFAI